MKTVDYYLNNRYNRDKKIKNTKKVSVPVSSMKNKEDNVDSIPINYPEIEDKVEKKQNKDNIVYKNILNENKRNIKNPIDLNLRRKRYEEGSTFVLKCSECGVVNGVAKKTSNNIDKTNIRCSNCNRDSVLHGYLSFSDNKFFQRTEDNAEWFDLNINGFLEKEKPRFVKF